MTAIAKLAEHKVLYRLGVMCGKTVLMTERFDDFTDMMMHAESIGDIYRSDLARCSVVIQAFKDDSYDFKKACFFQVRMPVYGIGDKADDIARAICKKFERGRLNASDA